MMHAASRVLIREVSLFQRLICTQEYTIGTSETVLIRVVSLFQRLICTQEYTIGTSETVLIREASQSHRNTSLPQCYRRNELEKKRAYDERVREIEHGSFSPLVFSTSGGMGTTATVVYKRIASMLSEKQDQSYSKTMHWIRCRLNFSLLRSAIMCLRGSRSAQHRPAGPSVSSDCMDLACSEGRVPGASQF